MKKLITSWAGGTAEVNRLRESINNALATADHIYIKLGQPGLNYELNNDFFGTVDFVEEFDSSRCTFFANCVPIHKDISNLHYINEMFFEGWQLYKRNSECKKLLDLCVNYEIKKTNLRFDLLLGEWNDTKDIIYSLIQQHPVMSSTLLTYYGKDVNKGSWSKYVMRPQQHTAETFISGSQIRCSDLIDPEIYNQTYYSSMVETVISPKFAMFSEKQAKPMVAGRPFVIFGSPGHLKAFRKLGFKSFAPVIDESYDDEPDMSKRFFMVLDSMHKLAQQNPFDVYDKLKDILIHNKLHFENNNWNSEFKIAQGECQ